MDNQCRVRSSLAARHPPRQIGLALQLWAELQEDNEHHLNRTREHAFRHFHLSPDTGNWPSSRQFAVVRRPSHAKKDVALAVRYFDVAGDYHSSNRLGTSWRAVGFSSRLDAEGALVGSS